MKYFHILILSILISNPLMSQDRWTYLFGGNVIDPVNGEISENTSLLIKNNRIEKIGKINTSEIPKTALKFNVTGKYIVPGLIDGHIHFFQSGGLYTRPDALDLRESMPYETETKQIKKSLNRTFLSYIKCGVTGVVDVGGPFWNFEIRKLAGKTLLAPRVKVAGPLISTIDNPKLDLGDPPIVKIETDKEARELIDRLAAKNPDLIKIWFIRGKDLDFQKNTELVNTIIKYCDSLNLRVAVHATELETAKAALKAGAKVLVHSVDDAPVDDEFIALMKKNNAIYIPTLVVLEGYYEAYSQDIRFSRQDFFIGDPYFGGSLFDLSGMDSNKIPARAAQMMANPGKPDWIKESEKYSAQNLKKLQDAGITIAMGTDAGNIGTLHASSIYREFEMMTDAGLTSLEILKSATHNGALLMGEEDNLGKIESGYLADLLIINENPLDDIQNLGKIHAVVKDGYMLFLNNLLKPGIEDLIQIQLNAYNAGDIEVFASTYALDVKLYESDGELILEGRDQLSARYGKIFQNNPKLHAKSEHRMVQGNYVVDQEIVTGFKGGETVKATAIYEVVEGFIQTVWFFREPKNNENEK